MVTHPGAECLLLRTSPEFVVEALESFGAVRAHDAPVWYYPSPSKPQLYLTIMCQRRDESDRLGLGDTIGDHILELIYERVQA